MDALDTIRARRSSGRLLEPAPSDAELRTILEAATHAPDHGELRPWRFIVLRGEAKDSFGEVLEATYVERCRVAGTEPTAGQLNKERTKLGRAPLVVVVAATRVDGTDIPWIEQQLSAGAAAQNMLLACTALGYGSMWRTGDPAYDPAVKAALGLAADDALIAFLYIGTPADGALPPASRPELDDLIVEWSPDGNG